MQALGSPREGVRFFQPHLDSASASKLFLLQKLCLSLCLFALLRNAHHWPRALNRVKDRAGCCVNHPLSLLLLVLLERQLWLPLHWSG